jgi:RimJ/RimL family protein N-acetyltransferase
MLIGNKIILDAIEKKDLEWMRYHRNDPNLRKYFREFKDISPLRQQEWYETDGSNTNHSHIYFKIMSKHTKRAGEAWDYSKIVGVCGLTNTNWVARRTELSVYVAPEHQGKGLAKDALVVMYNYAFDDLNMHSIYAEVYDNNPAVDFYINALGMTKDGVIRDTYYNDGKYGNSVMLTLLKDEWKAFRERGKK